MILFRLGLRLYLVVLRWPYCNPPEVYPSRLFSWIPKIFSKFSPLSIVESPVFSSTTLCPESFNSQSPSNCSACVLVKCCSIRSIKWYLAQTLSIGSLCWFLTFLLWTSFSYLVHSQKTPVTLAAPNTDFCFPHSAWLLLSFGLSSLHFLLERGLPRRKSEWMCSLPHAFLSSGGLYPVFFVVQCLKTIALHSFSSTIVVDGIVLSWPNLKCR